MNTEKYTTPETAKAAQFKMEQNILETMASDICDLLETLGVPAGDVMVDFQDNVPQICLGKMLIISIDITESSHKWNACLAGKFGHSFSFKTDSELLAFIISVIPFINNDPC